jgi:hypothetical protein
MPAVRILTLADFPAAQLVIRLALAADRADRLAHRPGDAGFCWACVVAFWKADDRTVADPSPEALAERAAALDMAEDALKLWGDAIIADLFPELAALLDAKGVPLLDDAPLPLAA